MLLLLALLIQDQSYFQSCHPHDEMMQHLQQQFGEKPVLSGTIGHQGLFEITGSETGSWSVIVTDRASKQSCMKAAGDNLNTTDWKPGRPA